MSPCPCGGVRRKSGATCRACHNDYMKSYYKTHPEYTRTENHRGKLKAAVAAAKEGPCVDCGRRFHPFAMDLDHARGEKRFNLSNAASKGRALATVLAEIAKCDLVCAVCHRLRTLARGSSSTSRASA